MKTKYFKFIVLVILQNLTFVKGGYSQIVNCPGTKITTTFKYPENTAMEPCDVQIITDVVTPPDGGIFGTSGYYSLSYKQYGGDIKFSYPSFTREVYVPKQEYQLTSRTYYFYNKNNSACIASSVAYMQKRNCINSTIQLNQFGKLVIYKENLKSDSNNVIGLNLSYGGGKRDPCIVTGINRKSWIEINGKPASLSSSLNSSFQISLSGFDFSRYIKPTDAGVNVCATFPSGGSSCIDNISKKCIYIPIVYKNITTALEDLYSSNKITLTPNPNNGSFNIETDLRFQKIVLTDISGKQETFEFDSNINTSLKGVLIATVFYQNGMTSKHKIITY